MDTMDNDDLKIFCRQVRQRSREHQQAMPVAMENDWRSISVGILRQELDSMVRVIYLLSQSSERRARLLARSVSGFRWRVTDREMVEHSANLHNWTKNVYDFGCRFIHLSSAHDYLARDPFQALPVDERRIIADFLNHYHGGVSIEPASENSTFEEVYPYIPQVLKKIATNLESTLKDLEQGCGLQSNRTL